MEKAQRPGEQPTAAPTGVPASARQSIEALFETTFLSGNGVWLETLYEAWLSDPDAVEPTWRDWFERLPGSEKRSERVAAAASHRAIRPRPATAAGSSDAQRAAAPGERRFTELPNRVPRFVDAYRVYGHQRARTDPLQRREQPMTPDLELEAHGLSEQDLDISFQSDALFGPGGAGPLREIRALLEAAYCGSIGAEYMHIQESVEKQWLQKRLEDVRARAALDAPARIDLLRRLTAAEGLERYLHARYVGQKRFSLEGGESLIPMLSAVIAHTGAQGAQEIVIGMAHRGRLNVLVNILGKRPSALFSEFEDKHARERASGDVKYHQGFSSNVRTPGGPVHLALAFNPSHLEIVAPVVQGSTRARQDRYGDPEGTRVVPVTIHGDAAFAGQGVVMETFNMSQSRGFTTRGTIHIIINNQIGFTVSDWLDARSSYYCSDVAKMVNAPIFHVNGDDPEAVLFVARLAVDYRNAFKKDVVIDLVCYRRHGHNEADAPAATQPIMYSRIAALPTTRQLYAKRLIGEGVIDAEEAKAMETRCRAALDAGECMQADLLPDEATAQTTAKNKSALPIDWDRFARHRWDEPCDTRISLSTLRDLEERLRALPTAFELHPRVAKIMDNRRKMSAGALPVDWGLAETLAYAALLRDGYPIRLCGQDSGRGTFFHRHAVLHNQRCDGSSYTPLQHLFEGQPRAQVIDSLLSEEAALAFEYGYATTSPDTLVIWEAQFGDFVNGAQVVIDQFISSGEEKWGRLSNLVMFLPHGYEGQGPEHSSGRIERFLQLCGGFNIQVCVPTTPAQIFHLLRRQMLRLYRKPLIVFTPKSLLRHKLAVSSLEALTEGEFHPVIPEPDALKADAVQRVVLCSGKVYYDLLEQRRSEEIDSIALIRIEQLYPFPHAALTETLARFPNAREYIWCQEEPKNQGVWYCSRHHLEKAAQAGDAPPRSLKCVARPLQASPAVGYIGLHVEQQRNLVAEALH